jgi:DNA-binding transcriptional LysR family regulator
MKRRLNLRQAEALKAVIESGTVSRAADLLSVSQPAVSKLLASLEEDTGLQLFERVKGRLTPTQRGMRLYEEIDRIFVGIRQVENAVESIRREEQGKLIVGVMPALSGAFIRRATMRFLQKRPHVHVTIQARSSQFIADWLVTRQLDVGLIISRIDNPSIVAEQLMEHPLVCIMPPDHPLTRKRVIEPRDLDGAPFLSFAPESYTGRRIAAIFETHGVRMNTVLTATIAPTVCEFVAAGLGISVVHPLFIDDMGSRIAVRRFMPPVLVDFALCRVRDSRNADLVEAFVTAAREAAADLSREMPGGASTPRARAQAQ